jgi:hypothetical protein
MCRVNSNESVPEAPEHIQLKFGLDTQHKGVLLQLRIRGRLISLVFVEHQCIIIPKSVDPKPHRYHILQVQAYLLLLHRAAQPADISRHNEFVLAAVGCGMMNSAYLQADQRRRQKYNSVTYDLFLIHLLH